MEPGAAPPSQGIALSYDFIRVPARFGSTPVLGSCRPGRRPSSSSHPASGFGAVKLNPEAVRLAMIHPAHATGFVGAPGKERLSTAILMRDAGARQLADPLDEPGIVRERRRPDYGIVKPTRMLEEHRTI